MKIPKSQGRYITPLDQIYRAWTKHNGSISPRWHPLFEERVIKLGLVWLPLVEIDRVFQLTSKLDEFEGLWDEFKKEEKEQLRLAQEERELRIKARDMQEAHRKTDYQRSVAICMSCDSGITTDGFCGCNRL